MNLQNLPYTGNDPSPYRGLWREIVSLVRLPLEIFAPVFSLEYLEKSQEESSRYRYENMLKAIIETATSSSDFFGVCVIDEQPHGYKIQQEWIQLQGGSFLTRTWSDLHNETTPMHSLNLKLDLREELEKLRREGFNLRSSNNKNPDVNTGIEGRISHIFLAVGQDSEWLGCQAPLLNGTYKNNTVNRIFDATSDGKMSIKLVG